MPDVSIIIVNWNGRAHLQRCLAAATSQQGVDAEVVLVDNASADGSVEFVRERFPSVRIVALEQNRGFAGGNNAGAHAATGRYLAFLNNDTEAAPGWLAALRASIDEPARVAFATSRIVYMHDPEVVDSAGDGLTRAGGAFKRFHGQPASRATEPREVFGACGAAFIMSAALYRELNGFDEDFFASYEDVDLSYRARLRGYRCWYAADAVVHHRGSATLGRSSKRSVFFAQRNLEWMYFKNTPGTLLLRTLPQHLVYTAAASVYFTRLGLLGTFLRAKGGALAGAGRVWAKRRAIQRDRVAGAADIWPHLEPRWLALKLAEEKFDLSIATGSAKAPAAK